MLDLVTDRRHILPTLSVRNSGQDASPHRSVNLQAVVHYPALSAVPADNQQNQQCCPQLVINDERGNLHDAPGAALLPSDPFRHRELIVVGMGELGRKLTRNLLHGPPVCVFLKGVINTGERIVEFLCSLAFKFPPVRPRGRQGAVWRREWLRCLVDGIDVQSNLIPEHVRIEDDSSASRETFPDHPPKGNAGETVTCAILHRSAPDI